MSDAYWETARQVCTPKQLRVLELRDRYGFSLRQIAYATGLSVSTIRSSLERSRQLLSAAMKETA